MKKETLRAIDGIGIYPVIALIIFALFFVTVFFWVVSIRKSEAEKMAAMPLNDGDKPEPAPQPSQGNTSHG